MRLQIVAERHSQTNERADRCPRKVFGEMSNVATRRKGKCHARDKQKNEHKIKVNTMTIYIY